MDLNRRELLKAVPAIAALAATASGLAEDLAPVSGTRDSGVMHGPAPAATSQGLRRAGFA
jgi:hypothetical protein